MRAPPGGLNNGFSLWAAVPKLSATRALYPLDAVENAVASAAVVNSAQE